jgi:hypothetical protein
MNWKSEPPLIDWDLSCSQPSEVIETDVCVIGTGPVGLSLARALAEKRRSVVLLERGPARAAQPPDSDVVFDRRPYRGATVGRAFGAGGTSTLWGGQLLPVREVDLQERPQIRAPAWPLAYAELAAHFAALETWLTVVPGSYQVPSAGVKSNSLAALRWIDFMPRLTKWTPFGRRNLYDAFGPAMSASKSIRVFVNARAAEWQLQQIGGLDRVTGLCARSFNGHVLHIRAEKYVVCAGALESARCIIEMNEASGRLSSGVEQLTGCFLHDHLSFRLARVNVLDKAAFQRLFAPTFAGSTMRSLRMELSRDFLARNNLPGLYAHFVFEPEPDSGFVLLRDLFRAVQQGNFGATLGRSRRLPRALPGIAALAFDRVARQRLSFPGNAQIYLQCDFEQPAVRENRVYLGEIGPGGRRALHVDWDLDGDANRIAAEVQSVMGRFWEANGLGRIATLENFEFKTDAALDPTNLYDIYHPAGTTRMSSDPDLGVVDADLLVHGTSNAYVVGSAVFPSIGAANPTFTAMALGLRLAALIDRELAEA